MAIDTVLYPEVSDLASPIKSFYPVKIPVSHWQLRHYISAPEADHLYYASGHDVYCLNTHSKKRKHVATLPFESRCSASGYGWVCIGGEEYGHFAAIRVNSSLPRTTEVDAALPIDSWRRGGTRNVNIERIGEEIVNSISIHRIEDETAHLDDIVAVLTNNDKTVRIYSLPQGLETTVLDLPFAMNHATISPDGKTLVAVGDYNQAYFFCRDLLATPPQIPKPHNRLTSAHVGWTLTNVVDIPGRDPSRGYFTTAWSPNGRLVALGSEGGYITLFDLEILTNSDHEDEDAIVAVVPSSRADHTISHAGAVRSMLFAPDPWDLLIWAEDQGRICIADIRNGLRGKQVVHLEPKDTSLKHVSYEDVSAGESVALIAPLGGNDDLTVDPVRRHRYHTEHEGAADSEADHLQARVRQRQHREQIASAGTQTADSFNFDAFFDDPQGLTAREQHILNSLRTSRQREEARARGERPASINYTTLQALTSSGPRSRTTAPTLPSSPNITTEESAAHYSRTTRIAAGALRPSSSHGRSFSPPALPPLHTLNEFSWATRRSSILPRLSDGSRLPRRRASVVLSPPLHTAASPSSSVPSTVVNSPAQPSGGDHTGEERDPWQTIEEYVSLARGPLFESAAVAPAGPPMPAISSSRMINRQAGTPESQDRERQVPRSRDRWRYTRVEAGPSGANGESLTTTRLPVERRAPTFSESYDTMLRRPHLRGMSNREIGVRTAGLAMSPDGQVLWAACEEGIFEMQLNLKTRMFWPAIEPR